MYRTNSNIHVDFKLAGIYRVNYADTGITTYAALQDWVLTGGAYSEMDEVKTRRKECAADFCYLYKADGPSSDGTAGRANRDSCYAVGEPWDFTEGWADIVGHEFGHLFLLNDNSAHPPNPVPPGNNGYYGIDCNNNCFGTMMTYAHPQATCRIKIPYFSTNKSINVFFPQDSLSSDPIGTCPGGQTYVIGDGNNDSAPIAEGNRQSRSSFVNDQATVSLSSLTVASEDFFDVRAQSTLNVNGVTIQSSGDIALRSGGAINISSLTVNSGAQLSIYSGAGALPKQVKENIASHEAPIRFNPLPVEFSCNIIRYGTVVILDVDTPEECDIRIELFNMQGRKVIDRALGAFSAGRHRVVLMNRFPTGRGMYTAAIRAGKKQVHKQIML